MEKNGLVLATLSQIKEILSLLIQAIPSTLTKEAAEKIIYNKAQLIKGLQTVFLEIGAEATGIEILTTWEIFYAEVFDENVNFSGLQLPVKQKGFNWPIIMRAGLTAQNLFNKCKERFSILLDVNASDLDTIHSERTTEKSYGIWVRDRIEADEENMFTSAIDCHKKAIKGITLEERLLLELFYHWRTGNHLDQRNFTLCAGSQFSNVSVPYVYYSGVGVRIDCSNPLDGPEDLRTRTVVV